MNREERIEEILRSMKSFVKQKYRKDELLQECFLLQEEMGGLTYREEHARQGNLKLWDVRYHLVRLNEERGHVVDAELVQSRMQDCEQPDQGGSFRKQRGEEGLPCVEVHKESALHFT